MVSSAWTENAKRRCGNQKSAKNPQGRHHTFERGSRTTRAVSVETKRVVETVTTRRIEWYQVRDQEMSSCIEKRNF